MTLWIINLTSTHSKLSKNVYVYCIIPSSLFSKKKFKWAKTVCLQEPSMPFCGVLNELRQESAESKTSESGSWQFRVRECCLGHGMARGVWGKHVYFSLDTGTPRTEKLKIGMRLRLSVRVVYPTIQHWHGPT